MLAAVKAGKGKRMSVPTHVQLRYCCSPCSAMFRGFLSSGVVGALNRPDEARYAL